MQNKIFPFLPKEIEDRIKAFVLESPTAKLIKNLSFNNRHITILDPNAYFLKVLFCQNMVCFNEGKFEIYKSKPILRKNVKFQRCFSKSGF